MIPKFALLVVCLVVAVGPALAESPGVMSIYFDEAATIFEDGSVPVGVRTTYICYTDAPFAAIQGYEFQYQVDGSAMFMDLTSRGGEATVSEIGGGFHVDFQQQLAVEPVTVLAEVRLFAKDASPCYLKLSGLDTNPWTELDLPVVVLPDGTYQPVCTASWNPDLQEPEYCAAFNHNYIVPLEKSYECFGIVAAEEQTWDAVKSLYR